MRSARPPCAPRSSALDGVWANDHLQSPGRVKQDPAFDAFTTLAALAAVTRRVRLGTVVMSASYRPPLLAAKMATILDVISAGRLVIGLGSGSNEEEHAAFHVPFPPPADRTERLRVTLETLRAMFTGVRRPGGRPPPRCRPTARPPPGPAVRRSGWRRTVRGCCASRASAPTASLPPSTAPRWWSAGSRSPRRRGWP